MIENWRSKSEKKEQSELILDIPVGNDCKISGI